MYDCFLCSCSRIQLEAQCVIMLQLDSITDHITVNLKLFLFFFLVFLNQSLTFVFNVCENSLKKGNKKQSIFIKQFLIKGDSKNKKPLLLHVHCFYFLLLWLFFSKKPPRLELLISNTYNRYIDLEIHASTVNKRHETIYPC